MKQRQLRMALLLLALAFLTMPLVVVHGIVHRAGGRIEGKITDPKGAIVVGVTVTVTDPVTNQTFTAVTDQEGHYKIEGLAAGAIRSSFGAGFQKARRRRKSRRGRG